MYSYQATPQQIAHLNSEPAFCIGKNFGLLMIAGGILLLLDKKNTMLGVISLAAGSYEYLMCP
jgi:hypothetical protein